MRARPYGLPMLAVALLAGCGGSEEPSSDASPSSSGSGGAPADAGPPRFELVGHSDLGARGMNAALAVLGDHVYVGSRTDGVNHVSAGVLVVDVSDPAAPAVVGEIGAPEEALQGMSSRELRADPATKRLYVLNFSCSDQIHECKRSLSKFPDTGGAAETDNLRIYDVSSPAQPVLVGKYDFGTHPGVESTKPHEMFLWRDPASAGRTLLYLTTPPGPPAVQVLDVSNPADVHVVATWDAHQDAALEEPVPDAIAHSMAVSADGAVGYLSYLGAGFFAVDTTDLASAASAPEIRPLTPIAQRIDYVPPEPVGTHSAVPLPGRGLVLLTDEVYGPPVHPGCPWGWARVVDATDPAKPAIVSELRMAENQPAFCAEPAGSAPQTTYTAHNPTVTENLALITWHSAGLVAVDLTNAATPAVLATFLPEPLPQVTVEDPMFRGNPVAMWSYPVVQEGLIYVIDVRNGLYVLRYKGPLEDELATRAFLEGNSNVE